MTMSLTTADTNVQQQQQHPMPLHERRSSRNGTHHHRSRSRLRCIPCGRCHAVIQHDSRAPWSVVNKLVNMHWDACPGKPHVLLAQVPPPPPQSEWPAPLVSPPTGGPGSTSRGPLKKDSGGERELAGPTRTVSSVASAGWERKRKTEEQRKKELEEDEYAKNVTATSVTCVGCGKQISLDKRSRYYPGLWVKHKNKCPDVERIKVGELPYCACRFCLHGLTLLKRATGFGGSPQSPEGDQSVSQPPSTVASTPSAHSAVNETTSLSGQENDSRVGGEPESRMERMDQDNLQWGNGTAVVTRGRIYSGYYTDSSNEDEFEGEESEEGEGMDPLSHVPFPGRSSIRPTHQNIRN
ncbi:hypothetical protein V8B97DRAFT_1124211 [Scleroderma yunnanense]